MCACVCGHGRRGAVTAAGEGGSGSLLPGVCGERAAAQCQLVRPFSLSLAPNPTLDPLRAIELANSVGEDGGLVGETRLSHSQQLLRGELCQYYHGLSLHRLGEFRRAAHALTSCNSPEAFFLRCYSLYLVSGPQLISHSGVSQLCLGWREAEGG